MPYRDFDTGFWNDPFIQGLPKDAKVLYLYLWTNEHCKQAGLYEITPRTIVFETGLAEDDIPELFKHLENKVKWYPEANLVWVKAFLKRQARSSKFLQSAAKSLTTIQHNDAVHEVIEYNAKKYSISIPYQYYMDRIKGELWSAAAAGTDADAGTGLDEGEIVKGEIETGEAVPASESEYGESLSEGDREVISTWCSVKGFNLSLSDASELVARLRKEFTDVDILQESKKWAARKLSEPLTSKSRPSSQIWNWMCNARKFAEERKVKGRPSEDPDKYTKGRYGHLVQK